MAEKQLAYRASGKDEFFADDDPLAELARIVGFEPRPAAQAATPAQRQDPAFDLEDELLREFERYDSPRGAPANDVSVSPETSSMGGGAQSRPVIEAEPQPAAELPSQRTEPQFVEPQAQAVPVKPTLGARDLIDELEMSIAPAKQPPAVPVPPAPTPQWAAATLRLPIANFNAATKSEAPRVAAPPPVEAAPPAPVADADFDPVLDAAFPMESDAGSDVSRYETEWLEQPTPAPTPAAVEPEVVPKPEPKRAEAVITRPSEEETAAIAAEIDDLLADVSRYPVPSRTEAPTAKIEPDLDVFGSQPLEPAIAAAPVRNVEPQRELTQTVAADVVDQDFEFDLADIEMELAELDFAETAKAPVKPASAPVVAPQPAPIVSRATPVIPSRAPQPEPTTPLVTASAASMAAAASAAVMARATQAPRVEPAPVAAAPAPVAPPRKAAPILDADQPLPFDPTEISETDDRVETFEGTHVPHLPPVEKEEPLAVSPEYDFDIDAEMASLFGTPAKEPAPAPAKPAAVVVGTASMAAAWSKNAAPKDVAAPKKPLEEFDEFERALEEDFRRSFHESTHPTENVARMTLDPAVVATRRRPVRSIRGLATAAAVIAVLGLGAYGIYGWIHHGSSFGGLSGEPRVITADADPVKVAPANPGGTVVPNQDKAVYDRVAGDGSAAPKQKELVSSNEQPVDVVQKTLIPEAVSPDDNDGGADVAPTPVGETEDPRLLPNQTGNSTADASADDQAEVPSVSPRKVRTMIVKPDGSLVARDEPAPAVDKAVTTATATPKATVASNTPGNQAASSALRTTRPDTPPPAVAPVSQSALADAADSDAASAESTPIRVVKTSKVADAKPTPVPNARPAQQPAAAAAAPAAARPAPAQQVASATPPAAATQAPAASAGAGGYGVQIASLPSEEDAKRSQANLKVKFASVIGGHPLEIRKADIAGKGTYYRVRVVAGSKDEAADICQRYRAAGGSCLISK